jgi:hypothetical protein
MIFIETSVFTKLLSDYLSDEDYRALQTYLIQKPDVGDIVKGSPVVLGNFAGLPLEREKAVVFELSTIGRSLIVRFECLRFIVNRSDLRFLVIF